MFNRLESLIRNVALLLMAFSGTLYFGSRSIFNDSSLLEFIAFMFLSGVFSFGVCYALTGYFFFDLKILGTIMYFFGLLALE